MYLHFYKRKRKRFLKALTIVFICLSALSLTFFISNNQQKEKNYETTPETDDKAVVSSLPAEKKVSEGIMHITYNYNCGHKVEEEKQIPSSYIEKTPSEILTEFNNIESVDFKNGKLTVTMNISTECMNHYTAKLYENTIRIFPSSNPTAIEKEIIINPDYFYKEELEELKNGISLNSQNEMLEFIENYQS